MPKFFSGLLLVGLFAVENTAAIAADYQKGVVGGPGASTCGEFAAAYRRDPNYAETLYFPWAQGFMSGQNMLAMIATGKSIDLSAVSLQQLDSGIREYCDAHPLLPYAIAVEREYGSLPKPPEVRKFLNSLGGDQANAKR